MKTGDMMLHAERQIRERFLSDTVLLLALFAAGAAAFWFYTPVRDVMAKIHQIAMAKGGF